MEPLVLGDRLEAVVVAMLMYGNYGIDLFVGQSVDRRVHLGYGQVPQCVERAVVKCLPERTFQGQSLDPDTFVECCELHVAIPLPVSQGIVCKFQNAARKVRSKINI